MTEFYPEENIPTFDDSLKLYIDEPSILNDFRKKTPNPDLVFAINFMAKKWPHLIKVFVLNHSEEIQYPFSFTSIKEKPANINKTYLLISNNYDELFRWEKMLGKSIAYNVTRTSKQNWDGLKMYNGMKEEEFILILRKSMHLYE